MRFDYITHVKLYALREAVDRRGIIATFTVREMPNREYGMNTAATFIRDVITLLSPGYASCPELFGESQDCWVYEGARKWDFFVRHKYWSDEQVEAFYAIVLTLARLHGWSVEDVRAEGVSAG